MVQHSKVLLQLVAGSDQFVRRANALTPSQFPQLKTNVGLGFLVDKVRVYGFEECTSLRSAGVPKINGLVVDSAPLNWPAHTATKSLLNPSQWLRRCLPNRHHQDMRSAVRAVFFSNGDSALSIEKPRSVRAFHVSRHVVPFELLTLLLRQLYQMTAA